MDSDMFIRYDYTETKDLLKSFITLLSTLFVFSVTFSEKIAGSKDSVRHRTIVVWSWSLQLLAILLCGISMCAIAAAAGMVLYGEIPVFTISGGTWARISWALILVAGASFVVSLILLLIAAARHMWRAGAPDPM